MHYGYAAGGDCGGSRGGYRRVARITINFEIQWIAWSVWKAPGADDLGQSSGTFSDLKGDWAAFTILL